VNSISKSTSSVRVHEHEILVEDRDGGVGLDEVGGDLARALAARRHGLGLVALEAHDQVLDVEDDVGDILHGRR
jgi:hypothetical protein